MRKCCYIIQGEKKPPIRYKWDTVSKRMVQIGCKQPVKTQCCTEISFDGGDSTNNFCTILADNTNGTPVDGGNS